MGDSATFAVDNYFLHEGHDHTPNRDPYKIHRALTAASRSEVIDSLCRKLSLSKLNDRQETESSLEDVLDTGYTFRGYGRYFTIQPMQVREELRELAVLLDEHAPESIVEIGTATGGTFYVLCRYLQTTDLIVSVDVPGGVPGDGMGGGYSTGRAEFMRSFATDKRLEFVRQNSHSYDTVRQIENVLGDRDIDFLFIDGDHTYGGVKADFDLYKRVLADDAIVAVHDIKGPETPYCEVSRFWDEIKERYRTREIVGRQEQTWAGIGIIYL